MITTLQKDQLTPKELLSFEDTIRIVFTTNDVDHINQRMNYLGLPPLEQIYENYEASKGSIKNHKYYQDFVNVIHSLNTDSSFVDKNLSDFSIPFFLEFWSSILESNVVKEVFKANISLEINLKESLAQYFKKKIMEISYRVLVLEVNRIREENLFISDSEEQQFREFYLNYLTDESYYMFIYKQYPALIAKLMEFRNKFTSFFLEILTNYKKDISEIIDYFELDNTELLNIEFGKGDTHNNGLTVVKFTFNQKTIYYKPRDIEIDLLFNEIIELYNKNSQPEFILKYCKALSKEGYGWLEGIPHKKIEDYKTLEAYYKKMGVLLCWSYLFNTVDLHYENLIASDGFPVIVDLEGMFHNTRDDFFDSPDTNLARIEADYKIATSVLSTGMLPFNYGENESDISAIGAKGNVDSFIKVPTVVNPSTSRLQIQRDYIKLDGFQNNPDQKESYSNQDKEMILENLRSGFTNTYHFIQKNINEIKEKVLSKSQKIKVRSIIKPTMFYSNLKDLSNHPVFLTNELFQQLFYTRVVEDMSQNSGISRAEYESLLNGDIPYFTSTLRDTSLYSGDNSLVASSYFHKPALDLFIDKISSLGEQDLNFQLKLIQSRLMISSEYNATQVSSDAKLSTQSVESLMLKLREKANVFLNNILLDAIKVDDMYCWYAYETVGKHKETAKIMVTSMDNSLYSGLSGMSLLFLHSYKLNGDKSHLKIAENILTNILQSTVSLEAVPLGIFSGGYSIVYLLSQFYEITGDNKYLQFARKYIESSDAGLEKLESYDIIYGFSGILICLLNLYSYKSEMYIKNYIDLCMSKIMNGVVYENNKAIGWKMDNANILTGFSHGGSGIVYALAKWIDMFASQSSEVEQVKKVIQEVNSYEDTQKVQGNYIDRREEEYISIPYAWCHGAPGILLSRLYTSNNDNDQLYILIEDIKANGFGRNQSLCHGDFGNLVILYNAAIQLNDTNLKSWVLNKAYQIVDSLDYSMLTSGLVVKDLTVPEFMIGNSGITWALLYLSSVELPNILKIDK